MLFTFPSWRVRDDPPRDEPYKKRAYGGAKKHGS